MTLFQDSSNHHDSSKKHGCRGGVGGGGAYFSYISIWKTLKIDVEPTLYKRHVPAGCRSRSVGYCRFCHVLAHFYIENFKSLLVRNHWIDFNIIRQKYSFGDCLT